MLNNNLQKFNRAKINPLLWGQVSVLNINHKHNVLVSCFNFEKSKQIFEKLKLDFTPYPFVGCLFAKLTVEELQIVSQIRQVKYINPCVKVCTEQKQIESTNLGVLTKNQYLGNGQTICFIDTGIHPHFDFLFPRSRILKFVDLINHQPSPYDDNGHGSFVAGIACGNGCLNGERIGFAPKANIVAIKALGSNGTSDSNIILDAMQWVYENYKKYKISVVCMSFGADILNNNDPLSRGAEALWNRGLVVVAAAGNSGPDQGTIKSPGNNPSIITVGGYDENNNSVADFSSRGPTRFGFKPDLIAPAVDVVACGIDADYPYFSMSGTSVATPIVAGICADIKSRFPNIKNNQIKQLLLENCTPISGDRNQEGAGLLKF